MAQHTPGRRPVSSSSSATCESANWPFVLRGSVSSCPFRGAKIHGGRSLQWVRETPAKQKQSRSLSRETTSSSQSRYSVPRCQRHFLLQQTGSLTLRTPKANDIRDQWYRRSLKFSLLRRGHAQSSFTEGVRVCKRGPARAAERAPTHKERHDSDCPPAAVRRATPW